MADRLRGASSPDVLVVGGGAIGVSAAYELALTGATVTLIEAGPELAAGSSWGAAGLICPSHSTPLANPAAVAHGLRWMLNSRSPFYIRPRLAVVPWLREFLRASTPERAAAGTRALRELGLLGRDLHADWSTRLATTFRRDGLLNLYWTPQAFQEGQREAADARDAGMSTRVLSTPEARELEPALSDRFAGAIYYPQDGHLNPRAFVEAVASGARDSGAQIATAAEVIDFRRTGRRITEVHTTAGVIRPGTVVAAAGVWTARLLASLGVRLLLEAAKGYHIQVNPTGSAPRIPVHIHEPRVIATPIDGRLRLSGTLELAGLNTDINQRRLAPFRAAAARTFANFTCDDSTTTVWRGLRPASPDGLPYIGHSHALDNLVVAAGHGALGLSHAPATGRLVRQLVTGETPTMDLTPFRVDRFRRTGLASAD